MALFTNNPLTLNRLELAVLCTLSWLICEIIQVRNCGKYNYSPCQISYLLFNFAFFFFFATTHHNFEILCDLSTLCFLLWNELLAISSGLVCCRELMRKSSLSQSLCVEKKKKATRRTWRALQNFGNVNPPVFWCTRFGVCFLCKTGHPAREPYYVTRSFFLLFFFQAYL